MARSSEKVPSGERRIHGIKFDGYRVQVHLANEAAKIFTLRWDDWTYRFTTDLASYIRPSWSSLLRIDGPRRREPSRSTRIRSER